MKQAGTPTYWNRKIFWGIGAVPVVGVVLLVGLKWGRLLVLSSRSADLLTVAVLGILVYTGVRVRIFYSRYRAMERRFHTVEVHCDRMTRLQEGLTAIASHREVESILQRVVELSREITEAEYGALAVLNPDESIARFITSGIPADAIRQMGSLPRGLGVLGAVIRTKKPLRVEEISQHPSFNGWPAHHPAMHTFMGVPMIYQNEVVGHLYLTNKAGGPFTERDQELVTMLATQATVWITNARLNRELEALAVVQERQRVGMDLHDGTIQAIYAVMLGIDGLLEKIPDDLAPIRRQLDGLGERLSHLTEDIRHYIFDLKRDRMDLRSEITELAAEMGMMDQVRIHSSDLVYRRLSPYQVGQLLAWVREALSNVHRHAPTAYVEVTWRSSAEGYQLSVEDTGQGFDTALPVGPGQYGLRNLRQRASAVGGTMTIVSQVGKGTRVAMEALFNFESDLSAKSGMAPGEEE